MPTLLTSQVFPEFFRNLLVSLEGKHYMPSPEKNP